MRKILSVAFLVLLCLSVALIPAYAATTVDGCLITWDGNPMSNPHYTDDGYVWTERVSASVPDIAWIQENGITLTRVVDSGSGATVTEKTISGNSALTGIGLIADGVYGNANFLVYFVLSPGASCMISGVDIVFPAPGTYFIRKTSEDGLNYRFCSSAYVEGFTFLPAYADVVPAEGVYFDIYGVLQSFIYGDVELSGDMSMTLTLLSTAACVSLVVSPFILVFGFFKRWI